MELHMPFIAYSLRGSTAKLVPILVGALTVDRFAAGLMLSLLISWLHSRERNIAKTLVAHKCRSCTRTAPPCMSD